MVSEFVFYSALYYQRVLPWHSATFRRVTFEANSLVNDESSSFNLDIAHMVMLSKIGTITFDDVKLMN